MKKSALLLREIMHISLIAISSVLICSNFLLAADTKAQVVAKRIDINFTNGKLSDALAAFSQVSKIQVAYDGIYLGVDRFQVSPKKFQNAQVGDVLTYLLKGTGITYKEVYNSLILFKSSAQVRVSGRVTDENGDVLPGVSIRVKDSSTGSVTNASGEYQITVSDPGTVLQFAYIGFNTQEIRVGKQTSLNVRMIANSSSLSEVVVTALNIKRDVRALSYSQQGVDVNAINEAKSPNFISGLSGKVSGVQIVPPVFNTGSARIVIRGNSSITGNNQPLFVVDGVPIDNTSGDEGSLDYGNNAADINTEDVENIQVLKGPNASALYGSRAANGVVLITTKKGSGKFKVSLNSSLMFQELTEFPEYQNTYGVGTSSYIDNTNTIPQAVKNYRSWGSPMLGQPYVAINGEVKPYLPQPNNVKDFYSTAALLTNALAVEGGNEHNSYRLSYTNYSGTSVVENFNKNNKHSLNFRMLNTPAKWLKFDTKVNFIHDIVNNRQYSNSNGRNPTNLYTHMARSTDLDELMPYKDEETGKEIGTHRNFSNPYWAINENPNRDVKDRLLASFNPEINLTPWIKFNARLGADMYWWEGYEFNNIGSVIASNPDGFMRTFNSKQMNYNLEGFFTVNRKFNDFSFVGLLGANSFGSTFERRESRINSLLQPGLINLSNAKEYPTVSQTIRRKRINSIYSSVSLGYRNYAFVDITARNDWSSTLPSKNNAYFYPSIGTSLVLSDIFNIKSDVLSFAKLRASYAMVGNDTDPYRLESTYSFDGFFDGATRASLNTTMNNPDLKPEKTSSYEWGVDLKLLKNRISIDVTQYSAATTNQIITAQLPSSSGYKQRLYNAGKIRNWGIETGLSGRIIENRNFNWQSRINFSKNNSEVVELLDGISRFQLNNNSSFIYVYAEVGKPYAHLRGLGVQRDANGNMLLEDGGGLLAKDNDKAYGSATPDWIGGFSNTFSYKQFDLGFLIDVKQGGVLYSGTMSRMLVNGVHAETLVGRDDYYRSRVIFGETDAELSGGAKWDAYYADGTKNTKFVSPQNYEYTRPNYAEFVMYDASFIKLREVTLGYTMPATLLKNTFLKGARVSVTGRNLAILHKNTPQGIDPEATSTSGNGQGIENGALPPNRLYGFNVRLTF